ncbi:dephospho-CoA kinase [Actinoalloteichus hoggarensis]|uniref:Dephospho-CoA kinase n=1 Tax=Actinoalloteichus hoggarensis TaxID=1470176 RepID=A0A221W1J1_9PSEU|nr:dephospho-CoA kinase [Actinoalloteichus hoggarensis]ASO19646.1 Dephospho-CoA kinase [Actinoalloteichus hoggarensis]MBB5919647.1 dephospho-CoA kinase [Actinoalloteichus hoggarensis]
MLRIGLTGGIGAGKSTVARRLAEQGAVIIDADRLARQVVEPGTAGLAEIVEAFGPRMLTAEGTLDRPAMGELVFVDPAARARLNGIVHPKVAARTADLLAEAPADAVVVHDVPLLVENGLAPGYHLVVVVDAAETVRVERLRRERGMTAEAVRARIASQASRADRQAVADVWLDNDGSPEELIARVDALSEERIRPFEENLRLGRPARLGDRSVGEHDPRWAAQAGRLIRRLRHELGDRAAGVEHVGATAEPGRPAPDVIELAVTVPSAAAADSLAPSLVAAGFPPVPVDEATAAPTAVAPGSRVHRSADPGRPAELYVVVGMNRPTEGLRV